MADLSPPNDEISSAEDLGTGTALVAIGNFLGATRSFGDPSIDGDTPRPTIWNAVPPPAGSVAVQSLHHG
ncbi:MAG: hypothetical protein R3F19_25595 [Verrucomicrobiales bacterium]